MRPNRKRSHRLRPRALPPRSPPLPSRTLRPPLPMRKPRWSSRTASAATTIAARTGGKSDARQLRRLARRCEAQVAETAEKMIRKLRAGMMPPAGRAAARRGDAHRRSSPRSRAQLDRAGGAPSQSGPAAVPAAESRRIRARGPRPASASTSTSRRFCPPTRSARLRQRRRRAEPSRRR